MRLARKALSTVLMISMVLGNFVVPVGSAVADTNTLDNTVLSSSNGYAATDITMAPGKDETELNFTWYSNGVSTNSAIQVAKKTDMTGTEFPTDKAITFTGTTSSAITGFLSNKVTVEDLQQSTEYVYHVGEGSAANWSLVYNFKTHETDSFSFLAVGDPQIGAGGNVDSDTAGWKETISKALTLFPEVSFLASVGDQIETKTAEDQYTGFFSPPELRSLPLAPLVGNHDNNAINYDDHFNLPNLSTQYGKTTTPGSGDYYFTYGKTLFMVLNTNNPSGTQHEAFIQETIAANPAATWKVVNFHQDIYGSSSHSTEAGIVNLRQALIPTFDKYKIDMVLDGHDHSYTRSYQMLGDQALTNQTVDAEGAVVNPLGTLYMTLNSGSGSKYYDLLATPETYAAVRTQIKVPTFSKITQTSNTLNISTYRTDTNAMIDTYTIKKDGSQTSYDLAEVTLTADGDTLVTEDAASEIKLTLAAKDSQNAPVDLTSAHVLYKTDKPDMLSIAADGTVTVKNKPAMDETVKVWAEVYNGTIFVPSNQLDVHVKNPLGLAEVTLAADGATLSTDTTTSIKLSVTGKDTLGANEDLSAATVVYKMDKEGVLAISTDGTVTVQTIPTNKVTVKISAEVTAGGKTVISNIVPIAVLAPSDGGTEIVVPIKSSLDDMEELTDGNLDDNSSDLEIPWASPTGADVGNQLLGLRFADLAIPKGATITSAYIQFSVDEPDKSFDPFNVNIYAEDVPNSAAIANVSHSISSRVKTTDLVNWKDAPLWTTEHEADIDEQTPNLAALAQKIVDKEGWNEGNALSFILSGVGNRTAESFEGAGSHLDQVPTLHVKYTTADTDSTISDARNLEVGETATVTGIVTCVNPTSTGSYFIQDSEAGINVYTSSLSLLPTPKLGDKIQVNGKITLYKGLLEIMPAAATDVTILSSNNTIPAPKIVTIDQVKDNESQRIIVKNVTLGTASGYNTPLTDADGKTINIFKIPALTGISAGDVVDVIATVSVYTTSQLLVQAASDITKVSSQPPSTTDKTFDIVEITDLHGNIGDTSANQVAGVLAENIKNNVFVNNQDRTLILAGGDNYQGTAISNLQHGESVMEIFNHIGVAASGLGNHEFDWGLDKVTNLTRPVTANYPIICANLFPKGNTTTPVFDPYKVFTRDGVKIAVVGGITESTPGIVLADYIKDYDVLSNVTYINKYVQQARAEGAQIVIALIHEGDNYSNGASGPIVDIAKNLVGVDAVMGGHTHDIVSTTVTTTAGKTMPLEIGNYNGKGYIDLKVTQHEDGSLTFGNANSAYVAQDTTSTVYPYGYKATTPRVDQTTKDIVAATMLEEGPILNEVLGSAQINLNRSQVGSPYGESLVGNWATDVTRSIGQAEFGFQNNGGLRCDIPQGQITMSTIYQFMPFDNTVVNCDMTGAQLKLLLEQAVGVDPSVPVAQQGGKGIHSGLKFTYDPSKPFGSKVSIINKSDGTSVDMNDTTKTYKVATNNFMTGGGDGFRAFLQASNVADTHILIRDALANAVKAAGTTGITASIEDRIDVVTVKDIPTDTSQPITVEAGVTKLQFAHLIVTPGFVTSSALPEITISAAVDLNSNGSPVTVQVQIPKGTTVSAPDGWDGTLNMPTVVPTNSVSVTPTSGSTATVNSVIEVGSENVPLTFDKAVRLLIPGQAGKKAGYIRDGQFKRISNLLPSDDQTTADALADGQEGYINVGSDLVIWTKHFTQFVTYTETPISNDGGGSSGGGGSISPAPAPTPTPTPIPTPPTINIPKIGLTRLAGLNSVDTALEIAKASYIGKVSNVILATAQNYPDALAGSVLAYKHKAPILLVGSTEEDQNKVLSYIKDYMDVNGTVYILGGTAVVSDGVEGKIAESGFSHITRLAGIDKYETALKIAEALDVTTGTPVVLAYGENYPDALSISSTAAAKQYPIFLVQKDGISDSVKSKSKIADIKPSKVYIIGGQAVISTVVEDEVTKLTALDEANIVRLAGVDRFETSLAVAKHFNLSGQNICVATGNNFPDALAGSVYAANANAPIILADVDLSENIMDYLTTRKSTGVTIFGGEAVVNKALEQELSQTLAK